MSDFSERKYQFPELESAWPADSSLGLDAGECYSVTTMLSVLPKPALVQWAAKLERENVVRCAKELSKDLDKPLTIEALVECLTEEPYAHKTKLSSAGNIGLSVHSMIEAYLRDGASSLAFTTAWDEAPDKVRAIFEGWRKWLEQAHLIGIGIEQKVHLEQDRYAGTVDYLAYRVGPNDTESFVFDWKTSAEIYDSHWMQVAAYADACVESGFTREPPGGCIVRLPKTLEDAAKCERKYGVPFEAKEKTWEELEPYAAAFGYCRALFSQLKRIANGKPTRRKRAA